MPNKAFSPLINHNKGIYAIVGISHQQPCYERLQYCEKKLSILKYNWITALPFQIYYLIFSFGRFTFCTGALSFQRHKCTQA